LASSEGGAEASGGTDFLFHPLALVVKHREGARARCLLWLAASVNVVTEFRQRGRLTRLSDRVAQKAHYLPVFARFLAAGTFLLVTVRDQVEASRGAIFVGNRGGTTPEDSTTKEIPWPR
jgi:hypothetical protein